MRGSATSTVKFSNLLPPPDNILNLSVIILTYNEELNLPDCLSSLHPLGVPVFVVDSGSTDATIQIAREFGAYHTQHPFESHAKQWCWALEHLPLATDWILGLDADQRLTPELVHELRGMFNGRTPSDCVGFYINRRQIFRGRWIRHGGYYPKYLLKLFDRRAVYLDDNDLVDHHFCVKGPTRILRGDLLEANRKEDAITFWIEKHNRYARRLAQEELARQLISQPPLNIRRVWGTPDDRTLVLKQIWRKLPLYLRPTLYFIYRYFFRLGFLDGKQGFIFHFLHGFWFRLLVDINLDELRQQQARQIQESTQ